MNLELIKIRNGRQYMELSVYTEIIVLDIRIREVLAIVEHLRIDLGGHHEVTKTYEAYLRTLQARREMFVKEYEESQRKSLDEIKAHKAINEALEGVE